MRSAPSFGTLSRRQRDYEHACASEDPGQDRLPRVEGRSPPHRVPIQWKRGKPTPTTCMLRLVSLTRVPFYSTTQLLHRANVLMYIFSGAELYTRNGLARCESPHAYVRAAPLVGLRLTTYLAADTPHLSKQRLRSPCQLYPAPGHTPSNRPVLVATASHLHRSPPRLYSPAYHLS